MTAGPQQRPAPALLAATVVVLCLIWGTTWAAIQIGLAGIPPFSGVALRFAIAAALLLGLAVWQRVPLGRTRRERWLWWGNAACAFCGSYGIVYWCEQWVPSGLAAVLFATYPLWVALLAHFTLPGEALHPLEGAGALIGFGGVGVIFSEDLAALGGREVAVASLVLLAAPLLSAMGSVLVKRWGAGIHPFSISGVPMALTAGIMGAVALGVERDREFSWTPTALGALLYLAVFGSALTFSLYYWLLEHLPVKRLALIAYVIPVVAVLVGVLRGEPLTIRILAGAALVVAGVAITVQRRRPPRAPRPGVEPAGDDQAARLGSAS